MYKLNSLKSFHDAVVTQPLIMAHRLPASLVTAIPTSLSAHNITRDCFPYMGLNLNMERTLCNKLYKSFTFSIVLTHKFLISDVSYRQMFRLD